MTDYSWQTAEQVLRRETAIVIPTYFAADHAAIGRAQLASTGAAAAAVASADLVYLVADGDGPAAIAVREIAAEIGVHAIVQPVNRGKFAAAAAGAQAALARSVPVEFIAVIDQDGDHFPNEIVNLVRAGLHARRAGGFDDVLVLGRRISRHRPMGLLRGELEELADRVLLDAVHFAAATTGTPLDLRFATTLEEFPDFHSGFKVFSRRIASRVFVDADPLACGASEACALRHSVEAVMTVEALLAGATLVIVNRSTFDDQPLSVFGRLELSRLVADKIVWPCLRLKIPPRFVGQWLDNHLPRLLLGTLAPDGRRTLLDVRRLVRADFGLPDDGAEDIVRPLFV